MDQKLVFPLGSLSFFKTVTMMASLQVVGKMFNFHEWHHSTFPGMADCCNSQLRRGSPTVTIEFILKNNVSN